MQQESALRVPGLAIYAFFAKRQPRSYVGKIMLIAFLGTHIPLLTLFFYALITTQLSAGHKVQMLVVALVATLVGTAATLFLLRQLLAPISATFLGLRHYLLENIKPQLPSHFTDEAGVLMADTMYAIGKLDETIQHLKQYDPLTALPNRFLFHTQLEQRLHQLRNRPPADRKPLAVVVLDVDNFANLNNNLGQKSGDLLLRQAAQRLATEAQAGHLLARIDGDEFAILYDDYRCFHEVVAQAKKVLMTLNQPFLLDSKEYYLTMSVGLATYTNPQDSASALLTNADTALRIAKQRGRNNIQCYLPDMNQTLTQRLELEREMRGALERGEFQLYYQPQVSFCTGKIIGAEALLRWYHPQKGFISPAQLIPIAEESGLILPIGEWVLREACRQNQAWCAAGLPPIRMAVNLSASQFHAADLVGLVSTILAETKLEPACLELEITESLLMQDVEKAISLLQQLRALGTTLALDDFGTGYSSLNYLKRFPLHYLKIDRSFVSGLPADSHDAAIVQAIVALAKSLHLDVIAEGVETATQADYLQQLDCTMFQGYYYSRPIPATEFAILFNKQSQQ